jgi:O-methyltransferase domain
VRRAATSDARLMVVESVIPETPEFNMGKWMDLNMMAMTTGRERTAVEFRDLFERADFWVEQIVPTSSPLSIVMGKPIA